MSEEALIQVRKDKHQQLNGGKYPLAELPSDMPFHIYVFIANYLNELRDLQVNDKVLTSIDPNELETKSYKYKIRGRISNIRKSGSITFIKLTDLSGSVQVIVSKSAYGEARYNGLKLLDLGDILEVGGYACLSKTGEKSLLTFGIQVLTKSHRAPPEKYWGLADQELKSRKRYLDLMSDEESRARFVVRTYIIRAIRDFMESRQFLEVETPTLVTVASGANAKPFETHHNALDIPLQLRIAPELYLKRLLVGGMEKVYEIGRNYRNEGIDTRHNPEFTMMECYEAYSNFKELIPFTKSLLAHITTYLATYLPLNVLEFYSQWKDKRSFTWSNWTDFVEVPMERVVQNALSNLKMKAYLDEPWYGEWYQFSPPEYCSDEILARQSKIDFMGLLFGLNRSKSRGERIALFFEYLVEPFLTEDYRSEDGKYSRPVFITQYPKDICPLARANDNDPSICDRFELFIEGRELANAFQELNDPDEQALRFREQLEAGGKDPMALDADYIEALEYGLPPAVGLGIGVDRLVMLLTNATSIKDVILFPTLRPLHESK